MASATAFLTIGPLRVHAAAMGLGVSVAAHAGLLAAMGYVRTGAREIEPADVLFAAGEPIRVQLGHEAAASEEPSFESDSLRRAELAPILAAPPAPAVLEPDRVARAAAARRPAPAAHAEAAGTLDHAAPLHDRSSRLPGGSAVAVRAPSDAALDQVEPGVDCGVTAIDLVAPRYPVRCRRLAHAGTVLLEVEVACDGRVSDVRVIGTSPCPDLTAAAIAAVRSSRFQPALRAGRPIDGRVEVPFEFTLGRVSSAP